MGDDLTQIYRRKAGWTKTVKILIGIGVHIALLTVPQIYPCLECKKTGFQPGSNDKVKCLNCGGDGRNSILGRHTEF